MARRAEHAPAEHDRTQVGERSGHKVPTEYQDNTLQVRDLRQTIAVILPFQLRPGPGCVEGRCPIHPSTSPAFSSRSWRRTPSEARSVTTS